MSSTELTPNRLLGTVRAVTLAGTPCACSGATSIRTSDRSLFAVSIDLTLPMMTPLYRTSA